MNGVWRRKNDLVVSPRLKKLHHLLLLPALPAPPLRPRPVPGRCKPLSEPDSFIIHPVVFVPCGTFCMLGSHLCPNPRVDVDGGHLRSLSPTWFLLPHPSSLLALLTLVALAVRNGSVLRLDVLPNAEKSRPIVCLLSPKDLPFPLLSPFGGDRISICSRSCDDQISRSSSTITCIERTGVGEEMEMIFF